MQVITGAVVNVSILLVVHDIMKKYLRKMSEKTTIISRWNESIQMDFVYFE
jgi:hypothetical protein